MSLFARYRESLLERIYEGSPWGGSNKLDSLWPLIVQGAIFAAFDIGLGLTNPFRLYLLGLLISPAVVWFGYVQFHEYKALRIWLKRRKSSKEAPNA